MKLDVKKGIKSVKEAMERRGFSEFVFRNKESKFATMSYKQCSFSGTFPFRVDIDITISATGWFAITMKNTDRTVPDVYNAAEEISRRSCWCATVDKDNIFTMTFDANGIDNEDLRLNIEGALNDILSGPGGNVLSKLSFRK